MPIHRVLPVAVILFTLVAVAAAQPIESFEKTTAPGIRNGGVAIERVREHATDGKWAMMCLYKGSERDTWPGMTVPLKGANVGQDRALLFDIFNPAGKEQVFNYRIDTADGGKTFGWAPLAAGKTTTVAAAFAAARDKHAGQAIKDIFIYVSKPREDVTLFLDNLRVADYVEKKPAPAPKPTPKPAPKAAAAAPKLEMGSVIESFENGDSPYARASGGAKGERVEKHATDGKTAYRLRIFGNAKDTWPGLAIRIPGLKVQREGSLAFDVVNEGTDAVKMAVRVDAEGGASTFASTTSIPPKRKKTVMIPLAQLGAKNYGKAITQTFPYVSKPRQDATLTFDNIRLISGEQTLDRAAYVELAPEPAASPQDKALGAILFRRSELAHVFPNSRPWPGEEVDALWTFAAQGEAQPVALSLHALKDLGTVTLEAGALRGASDALPASAVEVSVVRFMNKRFSYSSEDYIADTPRYAEPGNQFDSVPKGQSRTFWLRVRVPGGARGGVYKSALSLKADGRECKVPFTVHVLPFALPEATGYLIGEYYRLGLKPGSPEWRKTVEEDLADQRDHGMTSVGWCGGVHLKGKTSARDFFADDSPFAFLIETYVRLGFHESFLTLNDFGQKHAATAGAYGTPEYDAAYKAFWTEWTRIRAAKGWPEVIVQPVDEPGWKGDKEKARNVHLLKLLKQIPGMRTEQDGPGDNYFRNEAGPFADVWNYNGGVARFDKLREFAKNHVIVFYNNDVESYRPEVDRYATGFFQKAAGMNGVFNWEYRGGRGDLYNDLDGTGGDWVHSFPKTPDEKGGPSLAWEASRSGADDLKYMLLLGEWIEKARRTGGDAQSLAKRAEADLADLLDSLDAKPRVRSRARWTVTLKKDHVPEDLRDPKASKYIAGRLRLPNGWTLRDYCRARWRVANWIVRLMAACGASVPESTEAKATPASIEYLGAVSFPTTRARTQAATKGRPRYTIPKLSKAPTIDGMPDEAVWGEALKAAPFVSHTGGDPMAVQTRARIGWYGGNLYVAIWCDEPSMGGIVDRVVEDGEPTWTDDCVEVFLDPGRSGRWAQLVVNSRGTQWSTWGGERPWSGTVPTGATKGKDQWRVEVAIPLADFLRGGPDLGLNICRERRAGGSLELSCWQRTGGRFANPSRFAHVRLADAAKLVASLPEVEPEQPLVMLRPAAMIVGRDVWTCELEWQDKPDVLGAARVRLTATAGDGRKASVEVPGPIPAWARYAFAVSGLTPGECEMRLELLDSAGKVLGERKTRVQVVPGPRERF